MTYVSSRVAKKELHVHGNTLRTWANTGKIDHIVTPSGQRKYDLTSLKRTDPPENKRGIVYCRVSSTGQKDDLQRQISFMKERYPQHDIVTDVGSGLNYNRPGLRKIITASLRGNVYEVVVAHKDRLSRFSFDLIKWLLNSHGTSLVVLDNEETSPEKEMVEDLMSVVHVFSCRMHGQRKYTKRARPNQGISSVGEEHGGGEEDSQSSRRRKLDEKQVLEGGEGSGVQDPVAASASGGS